MRIGLRRGWAALALAAALGLTFAGAPGAAPAVAAEAGLTARPEIGRPVEQAETLLKEKRYDAALSALDKAEAVPKKTPYEVYVIQATRAVVLNDQGDYAGAAKALEAALATGILPHAEAASRIAVLVQLSYEAKDYAKVVAFAERYYREGGSDETPRRLMAQAYYLENDFADAARICRALAAADQAAGKPPPELVLQMLATSEYRRQHGEAYREALGELVANYPKRDYWRELVAAVAAEPAISSRLALDFDRLKAATGAMAGAADYMEAAQRALLAGFPGDARSFLDRGFAAGVLGKGADAARQQRLAALARRQSSEDLKDLPAQAKEAEAAHQGTRWVKLGEAYQSYGQYGAAIAALQKGLKQGGLADPAAARLNLGIAYLKAGRRADGEAVLRGITDRAGTGDLARLWLLAGKVQPMAAK
jgi:tetratricopeptide (TPR) repeat protein